MKLIKAGDRLISIEHITDVMRVPDNQGGGIHIVFVGGSSMRITAEEAEVAEVVWNWLSQQAINVMEPKQQRRPPSAPIIGN